jgi:hypothetical protein
MNDEHELGYEEPSQAEKWEANTRKLGLPCIIVFAMMAIVWLAIKYWPQ